MEQTVNKLSLDVSKNESAINEIVRLRQGDKQSHTIEANVTNHQKAYNLTDLSVEFQATKPDGHVVIDNATIKDASGGIISYRINNEVTAAAGKMTGYFTIKNGSNVVDSTASFNIIVEPSVSVNSVSGTYISTVDELISTLRQQVDTFKQESNTKIDNVQNEINTLNTTLTSAVSSAKDTATKAVIADLQTKLDKLLEQANGTKQNIDTLANNLNSQLTSKGDAAESLKSQIENDKSSAQTTLQSLNSIRDQGTTILDNFKTNTEKALSDLTTNVDGLVKKAISDNSEAFSNLQTNAQQLVTNLTSQLSDVKSKSDSWTNSSNSALDSFKTNSQQQLNSNIQTNNQAYTDAINAWKTKADKAISDFTTQAGNIINVKSATVNGGDKVTPDSTGNIALTVPNPDLSGYLTKTESNNNLSANYYNKHEVDDKLAPKGNVKSVNGVQPDAGGNITISGLTKSVKINGRIYMLDGNGNLTFPNMLSQIDVVDGYNIAARQSTVSVGGQTISSNGHNSGYLVSDTALLPFAQAINNLTARLDTLEHQPARGITDVDGTHHDVKFLSQSDYSALSKQDPDTMYITPES